jgi:ABC-type polysaccharide/polyol phosphate export permease
MSTYLLTTIDDIRSGASSWRIWTMLATTDIKQRYRRSALGQFWFTLSMGIMIFGLGFVYSTLFNMQIKDYIPYVTISFVFWGFISTIVADSTNAFIESERIMLHTYVASSTFVFRMMYRNLLVLSHNILIIPIVFALFGVGINANILWFIPGFILILLNGFWLSFVLAIISARYRDVPQIVSSVMQIMFFMTPIVFKPEQLADHAHFLRANPFANMLEIVREPLLGRPPSMESLAICLALAVVGFLFVLSFAGRYTRRIVFWL